MEIQQNILLKDHTTFRIGGPADFFVEVKNNEELGAALSFAREKELPFFILGGGSNILASDDRFRGVVIKIVSDTFSFEETGTYTARVRADAGVSFDALIAECVRRGYWGLENLSGIPGTVGATPIQNVGAYGVEVGECIEYVVVLDTHTLAFTTLTASECQFGYRTSLFRHDGGTHIVTEVCFVVSKVPRPRIHYADLARTFGAHTPTLQEIREAVLSIRAGKFPDWTRVGTAGSFFKNAFVTTATFETLQSQFPDMPHYKNTDGTIKIPSGWLLDKVAGVRGMCDGDVCSYEAQALVIVNRNNATARDVRAFAEKISRIIFERTHITLEWEVRTLS